MIAKSPFLACFGDENAFGCNEKLGPPSSSSHSKEGENRGEGTHMLNQKGYIQTQDMGREGGVFAQHVAHPVPQGELFSKGPTARDSVHDHSR